LCANPIRLAAGARCDSMGLRQIACLASPSEHQSQQHGLIHKHLPNIYNL